MRHLCLTPLFFLPIHPFSPCHPFLFSFFSRSRFHSHSRSFFSAPFSRSHSRSRFRSLSLLPFSLYCPYPFRRVIASPTRLKFLLCFSSVDQTFSISLAFLINLPSDLLTNFSIGQKQKKRTLKRIRFFRACSKN